MAEEDARSRAREEPLRWEGANKVDDGGAGMRSVCGRGD